jgi:hypothetical protein
MMNQKAIPHINFSIEPKKIEKGKPVILKWSVENAEKVVFWSSPIQPYAAEPLNWVRIEQIGKSVPLEDSFTIYPEITTAFYLVARGPVGMSRVRRIIAIPEKKISSLEPYAFSPQRRFLVEMVDAPHVFSPPIPPDYRRLDVKLSFKPNAIFCHETSTLSWNVSGDALMSTSMDGGFQEMCLEEAAGEISGTKENGGLAWYLGPPESIPASGSKTMPENWVEHGEFFYDIHATPVDLPEVHARDFLLIMSVPNFTGNVTQDRISYIREALKTLAGSRKIK